MQSSRRHSVAGMGLEGGVGRAGSGRKIEIRKSKLENPPPSVRAAASWRAAAAWLAAAGVALVWLSPLLGDAYAHRPAFADRGVFITVGKLIAEGAVPYRDVYDHKQPMIHLLGALAWRIAPGVPSIYRMEQAALLCLAAVMFALLRAAGLRVPAALAGLSAGLVVLRNPTVSEGGHLTEEYGIIFVMAAGAGALRARASAGGVARAGWAFVAGLATALALLTRESLALGLGALFATLYAPPWRDHAAVVTRIVWHLVGFLVPWTVWALYLSHTGAVDAYLEVFADNLAYGQAGTEMAFTALLATTITRLVQTVFAGDGLLAGAAAALLIAIPLSNWRHRAAVPALPALSLPLWAMVELVAIAAPARFYGHYYLALVPPCALLCGGAVDLILPRPWRTRDWRAWGRTLAAVSLLAVAVWRMDRPFRDGPPFPWRWMLTPFQPFPTDVTRQLARDAVAGRVQSYIPLTHNGPPVALEVPVPLGTRFFYQQPWLFRSADSPRVAEFLDDLAHTDLIIAMANRTRLGPAIEDEIRRVLQQHFRSRPSIEGVTFFYRRRE
jgi:hypothetical protein